MTESPFLNNTTAEPSVPVQAPVPVQNAIPGLGFAAGTAEHLPGSNPYQYSVHETLLKVDNLNVTYQEEDGNHVVLNNLSFDIRDIRRPGQKTGQIDVVLGPSGSGKTTLFRCIAGLQKPTSGAVYARPDTTADDQENLVPVRLGDVGVIAQDYPLFKHLSVMENLIEAAITSFKTRKASREAALEMLGRFNLIDKAKLYPKQLSGGQRQRIAIMQHMLRADRNLLMDEPFSGLDILARDKVIELIQQAACENELNSIIITTHDIYAALACGDTILLLGKDRDANGNPIPGARIQETINLMDAGLTWHPDIIQLPQFREVEAHIRAKFKEL